MKVFDRLLANSIDKHAWEDVVDYEEHRAPVNADVVEHWIKLGVGTTRVGRTLCSNSDVQELELSNGRIRVLWRVVR